MKRVFLFIWIVMLLVGQPVMGQTYREALRVNENGEVVALDSSGNSNKAPVFAHGIGINKTNLGMASEIWISKRTDSPPCVSNVCGSGTALDPYDGSTNTKFNAVWSTVVAPNGDKHVRLKEGTYTVTSVTSGNAFLIGDGNVIIEGEGQGKTIISTALACTMFNANTGTSGALNLTVRNLSLKYTGGYTTTANSFAIWTSSNHILNFTAEHVEFKDWTISILLPSTNLGIESTSTIERCRFVYSNGKASVSGISVVYPKIGIMGAMKNFKLAHNYFNGALSTTYTGLPGSPPTSWHMAMDGIWVSNSGGINFVIDDNDVVNHSIEGVYKSYNPADGSNPDFSLKITNNRFKAEPRTATNTEFAPAIRTNVTNGLVVSGNTCDGGHWGTLIIGDATQTRGKFVVQGNTFSNVTIGVSAQDAAQGGVISNNTIQIVNNPGSVVTDTGQAAQRNGVIVAGTSNGIDITENNISGGTGWWKVSTTTAAGTTTNVLHVVSTTGMASSGTIAIRPLTPAGIWRIAPVTGITSTTITLDPGWNAAAGITANAVVGDTVVYTPANNLSFTGGVWQPNGTNTTINRNTIKDIEVGVLKAGGTIRECNLNTITSEQEVNGTVNQKVIGIAANTNLITSTTTGAVADAGFGASDVSRLSVNNIFETAAYNGQTFVNANGPTGKRAVAFLLDNGVWSLLQLGNDKVTQIRTPLSISLTNGNAGFSGDIIGAGNIQAGSTGIVTGHTISSETTVAGDGSLLTNLDARRVSGTVRNVADTDTTLTTDDYIVRYTTLTTARVVTLPSAASANGVFFIIKDRAGTATDNPITFAAAVEGSTAAISINYGVVRVQSDGTNWYRL